MSILDLFGNVTAPSVTYQDDPEPTGYSALPAYLRSADNHNIANGNFSFTDPSSWIPAVEKLPKFIQAAALSGVNSFYNTGVAVNNFFGGNAEERDTAAWIGSIDNDLGMYYEDNRQSADLVGFIAGSFIPGIGGVKVLNAGMKVLNGAAKEGFIGRNLQTATNLLSPSNDFYIKQAARDIAQSQAQFSITNTNVLKALVAGVGSAALESAAFEVAVAATMFKSPILEDMDVKDITLNALMGVGVGAALGGVFNAAKTYSGIKRTISEVDKELMPVSSVTQLPETFRPADKIIQSFYDRDRVANTEIISKTILPDGIERARARTLNNLDNNVRSNFQALANGDAEIANMFADGVKGMDTNTLTNVLSHATEIGKVSTPLKVESKLRKFMKTTAAKLLDDSDVASPTTKVGYVKLSGEGRGGQYFDEAPKVLNIADEVKSADDVMKVVASKKFREKDIYNFTRETSHQDAEARYIWASRVAKITPDMSIGASDIPLLEKALETFGARQAVLQALENPTLNLRVGDMLITNTDDLYNHIKQTKIELATEMLSSKQAGNAITIDEIAKVTNLRKSYLDGQVSNDEFKDLFARQFFQEQHTKELISKGLWSTAKGLYPSKYERDVVYSLGRNNTDIKHEKNKVTIRAGKHLTDKPTVRNEKNTALIQMYLSEDNKNSYKVDYADYHLFLSYLSTQLTSQDLTESDYKNVIDKGYSFLKAEPTIELLKLMIKLLLEHTHPYNNVKTSNEVEDAKKLLNYDYDSIKSKYHKFN